MFIKFTIYLLTDDHIVSTAPSEKDFNQFLYLLYVQPRKIGSNPTLNRRRRIPGGHGIPHPARILQRFQSTVKTVLPGLRPNSS